MPARLSPGTVEQAPALAALLSRELGEGMYTAGKVVADLEESQARVTVALAGPTLVGAAISRLLVREDRGYYRGFGPAATVIFDGQPVGSFEAVAVSPAARRQGLGLALLEDALAWFRLSGCTAAVGISWISGRQGSSAGLFRRAGFTAGRTLPEFFLASSQEDGWTCPVCAGPCLCPAQFVSRGLEVPGPG